jgi:hypothetical protein
MQEWIHKYTYYYTEMKVARVRTMPMAAVTVVLRALLHASVLQLHVMILLQMLDVVVTQSLLSRGEQVLVYSMAPSDSERKKLS